MQNLTSFTLSQAGTPFSVPNNLLNGSQIVLTYLLSYEAAPSGSITISVEGISAANGGDVQVLDSYSFSSLAAQTRTISLSATYDGFNIVATWTGGQNVSVAGTLSSSIGSGPVFSSTQNLPTVHTM